MFVKVGSSDGLWILSGDVHVDGAVGEDGLYSP